MLREKGIAVIAIRSPTVPRNASRLRFALMATHKMADLKLALKTIGDCVNSLP